jgi:hypothetical protein
MALKALRLIAVLCTGVSMKYRLTFICGGAGKVEPGEVLDKYNLCEGQTPRFGYYWWHWLPTWHYNGGRPSRREVLDLNFGWLRWWCAVTAWPVHNYKQPS